MKNYVAENFRMGKVLESRRISAWGDEDAMRQAHAALRIRGASSPNGGKVQVIGIKRIK